MQIQKPAPTQTPTIGQVSTLSNMRAISSAPKLCQCGEPVKTLNLANRVLSAKYCSRCEAEIYEMENTARKRKLRESKKDKMKAALANVIPAVFIAAHIRHLSREFKLALLDVDYKIGFVLYGPVGRGKSYALAAIARRSIITRKKKVLRLTYEMLCLQIRDKYKAGSKKTELDVIAPLIDCDILILEDIGSTTSIGQTESDFSNRTFFVLLDSRIEACKPTLISTNKSKSNLNKSFDERIASRLNLFKWIGIGGTDRREKGN